MKTYALILLFIIIAGFLYHVTHEFFHIVIGKKAGLKLTGVQWFTYHGGTKVSFEGEEKITDDDNEKISKEWIYMSLAGITGTTLTGYVLAVVFLLLPIGYVRLFFWVMSAIFLVCDSGYAVFCSFSGGGDLYLVRKILGKKSSILKIISVLLFIFNIFIFLFITWK